MKLKRNDINELALWWNSALRKTPCILFGARQTGKSTLARDFAMQTGRKVIDINFWKDPEEKFKGIFSSNSSAKKVIENLELILNKKINSNTSILILDEIQECPNAYSLCKSFKEDTNLPIIATGSYLKLFLKNKTEDLKKFFIPVGCTYEINIKPLSFSEYLLNRNSFLYKKYLEYQFNSRVDDLIHSELLKIYYEYLYVGGLPEIASNFIAGVEKDLITSIKTTRILQKNILNGYKSDFLTFASKKIATGNISEKLNYTFDKIAYELYKNYNLDQPVQRFSFKSLGKNANFKRTAHIFEYLISCGLIIPTYFIENSKNWCENIKKNRFKCYYFDIGILNAQLNINYQTIFNDTWNSYKGFIAENYVAIQLAKTSEQIFSWNTKNYEIEFLINSNNELMPIEVKASKKSLKSKSLNNYLKKYSPKTAIKVAPRNYGENDGYIAIPIYFIEKLNDYISSKV